VAAGLGGRDYYPYGFCLVYAWFICLVYFMGFSEENEIVPGING